MKLLISILISICFFFSLNIGVHNSRNVIFAEQDVPPYAKWGKIAMQKTKERYPNANIVDYLYIGRDQGPKSSTEKFKLWLKQDKKEFGVFINIEFDNVTQKIINIRLRETTK